MSSENRTDDRRLTKKCNDGFTGKISLWDSQEKIFMVLSEGHDVLLRIWRNLTVLVESRVEEVRGDEGCVKFEVITTYQI